ncbi:MAG: hypothetical protein LBS74_00470 [Oscillospiraceae bacterium]|jgi:hypothetical protein|nr:hypothetical protein [Oscillospiraceae bacterium]
MKAVWIILTVLLALIAGVDIFTPDFIPFADEVLAVVGTIFTLYKSISSKKNGTKLPKTTGEAGEVYAYSPPKKKSRTPKGFPKYDKNNPAAVYYYGTEADDNKTED